MKKNYQKPTMSVVLLQHQQTLLSGSHPGYDVIGVDEPNLPPVPAATATATGTSKPPTATTGRRGGNSLGGHNKKAISNLLTQTDKI